MSLSLYPLTLSCQRRVTVSMEKTLKTETHPPCPETLTVEEGGREGRAVLLP